MVAILGVALATLAAVGVAGQVLFVRLGTDEGTANDALLVVLFINVLVIGSLGLVTGYPDYGLTPRAVAAFVAAGLVGTMVARALYYASIERIGASRSEPLKSASPLFATLVALAVLGEVPTPGNVVGICILVVGVGLVAYETSESQATGADRLHEFALPLVAAFFFGVEPTFAKLGLAEGTPVLVGLGVKTLAGTVGFVAYLRWRGSLPTLTSLSTDRRSVGWYVAAGLANTTFLIAYYSALGFAPVSIVVPIQQTSPLLVVAVSAVFLQRTERVTARLAGAATLVVVGAVILTLFG